MIMTEYDSSKYVNYIEVPSSGLISYLTRKVGSLMVEYDLSLRKGKDDFQYLCK